MNPIVDPSGVTAGNSIDFSPLCRIKATTSWMLKKDSRFICGCAIQNKMQIRCASRFPDSTHHRFEMVVCPVENGLVGLTGPCIFHVPELDLHASVSAATSSKSRFCHSSNGRHFPICTYLQVRSECLRRPHVRSCVAQRRRHKLSRTCPWGMNAPANSGRATH